MPQLTNLETRIVTYASQRKPKSRETSARKNISTREQKLPRNADTNRDTSSSPPPEGRTRRLSRKCQGGGGGTRQQPNTQILLPSNSGGSQEVPALSWQWNHVKLAASFSCTPSSDEASRRNSLSAHFEPKRFVQ